MLVDIHAHLDHEKFSGKLDKVMERCKKKNCYVITSGVNKSTNRKALEISEKYDNIYCSLGLYPIDALKKEMETGEFPRHIENLDVDEELKFISKNKNKIVSIGECGLDFHWDREHKEEQIKNFEKVIELAEKIKKPLVVHSRKAELEAIEILQTSKLKNIIMHCFSGKLKHVKKAKDLGYFFSIPPIILRVPQFKLLVEEVPITQLLTETDAPYLSAEKNKINEPINVEISVDEIKKIKKMDKQEVMNNIFFNFQKIFLKNL
jgi:TatD DNase family protein